MVNYLRANRKWYRINTVNERLADTTQLIFVTHALYHYMVTNYDNPLALLYPNWYALDSDIIDKVLTSPIKEHSRKIRHCQLIDYASTIRSKLQVFATVSLHVASLSPD